MRLISCMMIGLLCAGTSAQAQTDGFCAVLEQVNNEGSNSFGTWRGRYDSGTMDYSSTYRMPGATRCDIDVNDPSSPQFTCQWDYSSYEAAQPKQDELNRAIRECLGDNSPEERASEGIVRRSGKRVSRLTLNLGFLQPEFKIKRQEFSDGSASVFLIVEPQLRAEEERRAR